MLAQPAGNRAAATANLQAARTRSQTQEPNPELGHRVKAFGKQVQAAVLAGAGVRERLVRRSAISLPTAQVPAPARA